MYADAIHLKNCGRCLIGVKLRLNQALHRFKSVGFPAGLTPYKSLSAAGPNALSVRAVDAQVLKSIDLTEFAAKIIIAERGEYS